MAKKTVKEASTALIFATVFFVLTTIAFGVMWYMEFAERETNKAAVDAAKKSEVAATGLMNEAKLDAQTYRLFMDFGDDADKAAIASWADKDKKRAGETIKKLRQMVVDKIAKGDETKLPSELKLWNVSDAGVPESTLPGQSPLAIIGDLVSDRAAAQAKEAKAAELYAKAAADLTEQKKAYTAQTAAFAALAADLPTKFKKDFDTQIVKFDGRIKEFSAAEAKTRKEIDALADANGQLERDKKEYFNEHIDTLSKLIIDQTNKLINTQQRDAFITDEPQGKVVRRLADGILEINLGSDALVRPGLTFTVLPNDFPEKGRQSRIKVMRVQDDHGNYKNVERFVEKATIEVIEVVGPKLSRARITQEYDAIRDGAAPGDLLYNSVWRKGSADHIALMGIFDINGDGTDDITSVIRDLTHMGIPVDAYFDMKTRKWVGQITEQTRYVVEGWYPIQGVMDPNRDDKTKLLEAMHKGVKFAQEKGVVAIKFRDFFPRMGYKIKLDIPDDKVNQATAPYLNKVSSVETPMGP